MRGDRELGGGRAGAVLDDLVGLVSRLPVSAGFGEFLVAHLEEGREQAARAALPCAEVPLLVHGALAGSEAPAVSLAGACTLVYLGADLLDNVADRELPERWRRRSPEEATLAGAALLGPLVQLALDRLDGAAPPERARRVRRAFAEGLLAMAAGQREDLVGSAGDPASPAQVRRVAEAKSGAEIRLFAESAAILAGGDAGAVERLAAFGLAFGTALQLASDLADLCAGEASSDLALGKRTLPVAFALTRVRGAARRRLLATLRAAEADPAGRREALAALAAAGALTYGVAVVGVYRVRALRELEAVPGLRPAAAGELARLVDAVLPDFAGRSAERLASGQ